MAESGEIMCEQVRHIRKREMEIPYSEVGDHRGAKKKSTTKRFN